MIKPIPARSRTSAYVSRGASPPNLGSSTASTPVMKMLDFPVTEEPSNGTLSFDLRAARTDRLAALCLLLALCGPVVAGFSIGNSTYSAAYASLPGRSAAPKQGRKIVPTPVNAPLNTPAATPALSSANARRAALTAAQAPQDWRCSVLSPSLRARANDGADNPHPTRVMFPVSLLAKARVPESGALPVLQTVTPGAALGQPTDMVRSRLINEGLPAKPGPRSDAAISALPYVWKNGLASAPSQGLVRLADAKEQIKAGPNNSVQGGQLPALPQKADGTPDLSKMGKVVNATALKLPPPGQPLPPKLQAVAVPADTKYISSLPRLAQAGTSGNAMPEPSASNQIQVTVSTFVVLIAPDNLQTVAIADPDIADVVVVNSRAVLVNGKKPGATSLVIVDKKIRQYHVQVVPSTDNKSGDLADAVAAAINLPSVQVRVINGSVALSGQVANADEQKMAGDIASLFTDKVVNHTQIRPTVINEGPTVPLDTQIKNAIRTGGVEVRVLGNTVLLEGQVPSEAQRATAEAVAKALAKDMEVKNLLTIPAPPLPPAPKLLTLEQLNETLKPLQPPAPAPDVIGVVPAPVQPTTRITARQVADQVILEGVALTAEEIAQAEKIATRTGLNVVNRVSIARAPEALSSDVQALNGIAMAINRSVPGAKVMVSGGKERLVLTGTIPSTTSAVLAEQIARSYSPKIDNLLMTPRPQQVDMDITVLEINKNDLKNLGVTFTSLLDSTTSNPTGFVIGQGAPGVVSATPGSRAIQFQSPIQASIRAEVTRGNARILSNPRTTVLSGRTATFKVGGEVPIPGMTTLSGSGNATTSVVFKPFGILLDVTPVSSDDGVITAQIRTEVSQPDFSIGVVLPGGGGLVPGFSQRQAQTEVTIEPGGTLALGGLITNNITNTRREVPLLSRIPILGSLFQSKRFLKNESELVIFVTPRLLESKLKDGQLAPARPYSVGESEAAKVKMGITGIPSFVDSNSFLTATEGGGGQ